MNRLSRLPWETDRQCQALSGHPLSSYSSSLLSLQLVGHLSSPFDLSGAAGRAVPTVLQSSRMPVRKEADLEETQTQDKSPCPPGKTPRGSCRRGLLARTGASDCDHKLKYPQAQRSLGVFLPCSIALPGMVAFRQCHQAALHHELRRPGQILQLPRKHQRQLQRRQRLQGHTRPLTCLAAAL